MTDKSCLAGVLVLSVSWDKTCFLSYCNKSATSVCGNMLLLDKSAIYLSRDRDQL